MTTFYFNHRGSWGGGGPSIFVAKTDQALTKLGHQVIYDNPQKSDAAICIVETGKVLRQIDRKKTKVILRCDGIYNSIYNKKFGRSIRPDMKALHDKLKTDVPAVDWVVYQSNWSRDCIENEITKRESKWSIIHNGVDTNLFKPVMQQHDGTNIFHLGKMRDNYLMECLIGTYQELKQRHNIRLLLVGSMDAACMNIYNKYKSDSNIKYLGAFPNTNITQIFGQGDIYLGPREGSSSDNVIAEAQACGLPCVIPKFGGNKDMVIDKQTGIVVESNEWDYGPAYNKRLADGIEDIMKDLDGFRERARKHAVENLSLDKMVNKYINILQKV